MLTRFQTKVAARWHDQPLLNVLEQFHPKADAAIWYQRCLKQHVKVNAQAADPSMRLQKGQSIEYWIDNYQEPSVPTDWQIVFENDELLVIDKPALLSVSRTTRNPTQHLIGLVQAAGWPDAHLLHRLDRETSGLIVLGKTKVAAQYWQPRLRTLLQEKVYRACVWGRVPWQTRHVECYLNTQPESAIRCQMHVVPSDGQLAISDFTRLAQGRTQSIVQCRITTGRKHQIRAQLAFLGYPIVGDKIYSFEGKFYLKRLEDTLTEHDLYELGSPHHLLQADQLTLNFHDQIIRLCAQQTDLISQIE